MLFWNSRMDVLKRPKEEEDEEGNGSPGGQLAKRKALGNDREPQTQLDVEVLVIVYGTNSNCIPSAVPKRSHMASHARIQIQI